ncbi:MAG: DUF2783 domain-containing protein [Rhizobiaceae bacterium]
MLITKPNLSPPDDFYEILLAAHENLSQEQSVAFNARLILVLANHIGEMTVLSEALDVAGETSKPAE